VPIVDGIGSTEMLHIYCSNRMGDIRRGTSGKPVRGYELMLLDLDGNPADGSGQLFVRGDSCAAYYWHQHEKSKRCMVGEWFATGDRYRVDEDGYYVYEGRMDDMLKVGGLWVSPTDMETALMQHPAVSEAVVIGVEVDEVSRIKAVVIAADSEEAGEELADALRGWCKERLRRYEYPHVVEFVDDLPRTVTGKVQRFKLREGHSAR
jgi:benzoate-CoA ligase